MHTYDAVGATMKRLTRTFTLSVGLLLLAGAGAGAADVAGAATAARATDAANVSPAASAANAAGFIYGSDSDPVPITGQAPWPMTHLSGYYGGYIGMAGNWARTEGCSTGNFLAWSATNAAQAVDNNVRQHIGIGTGVYWYMGGPGVDPHWNGTATEASSWGAVQAADTLAAMKSIHVTYPVVWADIEFPGIKPAPDNGWNTVYTSSCSGVAKQTSIPAATDRAEFDGFANYITSHSSYKVGVYSSPSNWTSIFGTGTASQIPNTYEWTYQPETANLGAAPSGWCLSGGSGPCAQFFGGQTSASPYALMWQWSGGGGVRNAYGDYDQIDQARTPGATGSLLPAPAGMSQTVHGFTVNFSWGAVPGAQSYVFQLYHWNGSAIYGNAVANLHPTGTSLQGVQLPGGGTYAWRVRAYQPGGAWTAWRVF